MVASASHHVAANLQLGLGIRIIGSSKQPSILAQNLQASAKQLKKKNPSLQRNEFRRWSSFGMSQSQPWSKSNPTHRKPPCNLIDLEHFWNKSFILNKDMQIVTDILLLYKELHLKKQKIKANTKFYNHCTKATYNGWQIKGKKLHETTCSCHHWSRFLFWLSFLLKESKLQASKCSYQMQKVVSHVTRYS